MKKLREVGYRSQNAEESFVTVDEMREAEKIAQRRGMTDFDMMTEAGEAATRIILERANKYGRPDPWHQRKQRSAIVLCGKGNNGGDGFIVAKGLSEAGWAVNVVLVEGMPQSKTAQQAMSQLPQEVQILDNGLSGGYEALFSCDVLVDAIYGIGFHLPITDIVVKEWIRRADAAHWKVSLDIPSGVEANTGRCQQYFKADLTIVLGAFKPAHIVPWDKWYEKETVLVQTSLSSIIFEETMYHRVLSLYDCLNNFPQRTPWGHKGMNGRLLMFCGSRSFSGAAVLAAGAALRSGVGYACMASTEEVCQRVGYTYPEVLQYRLHADEVGGIDADGMKLAAITENATAVLAGCGLGNTESTFRLVKWLLEHVTKPLILDADALNVLEGHLDLLKNATGPVVLTPHPGEWVRLTNGFRKEGESDEALCRRFCEETGVLLLRKDAINRLYGAGRKTIISMMDNVGLSRGGSGDVLAGLIGSMLAQGVDLFEGVQCALWVHGRAAEFAQSRLTSACMLPSDVIASFADVFTELEEILE